MWPTRRFPFSAIATMDGVVLYPPRFGITDGVPSSTMATHEFVVPRSMPITLSLAIAAYFLPVFGRIASAVPELLGYEPSVCARHTRSGGGGYVLVWS